MCDCRRGGKQGVVTNVGRSKPTGSTDRRKEWRRGEIMEADMKKALGKYAEDEMGEEGRERDP